MTPTAILEATATAFGLSVADLTGNTRAQQHVWARQAAMLLIRYLLPWLSVTDIGRTLHKDHTTVLFGIDAARERGRRPENKHYQQAILRIAGELGS